MKPLFEKETAVVTAQNGLPWWYFYGFEGQYANRRMESVDPGGRQWDAIGPERAIGCTVYPATEVVEPGVIKHIDGNKFGLGEPDAATDAACAEARARFSGGGPQGAGDPGNPQRHLAQALGQSLLQPDLGADARDARHRRDRTRHARNLSRNMMLEAEKIGRRIGVHFRVDVDRRIDGAARVGAHKHLDAAGRGERPAARDRRAATCVQEIGRLAEVETPHIDAVLALTQQMARTKGLYPVFPDLPATEDDLVVD